MSREIRGALRVMACAAALAVAGIVALVASGPAAAAESTYPQGVPGSPFSLVGPLSPDVVVSGGSDQSVSPKIGVLQVLDAGSPGYASLGVTAADPSSVQALSDGGTLVADAANKLVAEFDAGGALVWSYGVVNDAALRLPVCAYRLADGSTLIVDKDAARVFIVNPAGGLEWQYGTTGQAGSGVDQLDSPTSATVDADGNVAICDAGNHRVIVVRYADYRSGFSADSIVWQYGTTGVSGDGVDELVTPASVQPLTSSGGSMLICDAAAGHVVEVRTSDFSPSAPDHGFTAASVVWQYPAAGSSTDSLTTPGCALGMFGSDHVVWIADTGAGRVLGVATGPSSGPPTGHDVFAEYGPGSVAPFAGSLSAPASLSQSLDGPLVVADPGGQRVVVIGATFDNVVPPWVASKTLDCGLAGRKRFASITCTFAPVPLSSFTLAYRVDGGASKVLGTFGYGVYANSGVETMPFPPLTVGTRISYQVIFKFGSLAFGAELQSLTISYERWGKPSKGKGGGGDSGNRKNSNGAGGTHARPARSAGGGAGSGGGVGGGTGSGSGAGAGSGRGSGSGSVAGSDTGVAGVSAAGVEVPSAQSTSGSAAAGQVSGYAFRASGVSGGGEGGGASPKPAWLRLALVTLSVAGVALLALVGPWAARRRLRLFVNWDLDLVRPFPAERTRSMPLPRRPLPRRPRRA